MKELTIKVETRTAKGKGGAGRVRRSGSVPAVLYTEGKPGRLLQLSEHDFLKTMKGHALGGQILSLVVGEEAPRHVLLKEIKHHPVSGRILHADFYEISMTRKLRIEIPVRLIGTPEGVSQQGGVLEHVVRSVLV